MWYGEHKPIIKFNPDGSVIKFYDWTMKFDQYEKYFLWIDRYADGKLKEIRDGWSQGELIMAWYPNEQLRYKCSFGTGGFRRNKANRWKIESEPEIVEQWYPDGTIQSRYDSSKQSYQYWYSNGQPIRTEHKNYTYTYDENGQIKSIYNKKSHTYWFPDQARTKTTTEDMEKMENYNESKKTKNGKSKQVHFSPDIPPDK